MKPAAVEGVLIEYSVGGKVASATETLGPAIDTVKVDGNGLYAGNLNISVTNATDGQGATAGTGAGVFVPSSSYCTADGEKLLLEGDEATIQVAGTKNGEPFTWTLTAKMKSAGQDSFFAE